MNTGNLYPPSKCYKNQPMQKHGAGKIVETGLFVS